MPKKAEIKQETIRKDDIARLVADRANLELKTTQKVIDLFLETVGNQLTAGNKIALFGFGNFEPVQKAARTGVNPKTKESIKIAAHKSAKFKPSKVLKESLNGKE